VAVGFRVRSNVWVVGSQDFLNAFFSTISANREPDGWGTRFPALQNELYAGRLAADDVPAALSELKAIRDELKSLSPDDVVWDAEDLDRRPPWGDDISPEITDLSNYFVTQDGRDLVEVLSEALAYAQRSGADMTIESGV